MLPRWSPYSSSLYWAFKLRACRFGLIEFPHAPMLCRGCEAEEDLKLIVDTLRTAVASSPWNATMRVVRRWVGKWQSRGAHSASTWWTMTLSSRCRAQPTAWRISNAQTLPNFSQRGFRTKMICTRLSGYRNSSIVLGEERTTRRAI